MVRIPYGRTELLLALIGVDESKFSDEKKESLEKALEPFTPKNTAEFNQRAAAHHGISVETLINSPNCKDLREEYQQYSMGLIVQKIATEMEITKKQAWAIIAAATDLLNE